MPINVFLVCAISVENIKIYRNLNAITIFPARSVEGLRLFVLLCEGEGAEAGGKMVFMVLPVVGKK